MRILVTGARGMLGTALVPCLEKQHEVMGADLRDFDVSQNSAVERVFKDLRPGLVFHLAAYTDVEGCEANPQKAQETNAQGTRNVARACADIGAVLLYLSTDYIFEGSLERPYREDDAPHPVSAYGLSKLAGERHVQALLPRHYIVRSSWVFGPRGNNFVAKILKIAKEQNEVRVVSDQRGSPTYTSHLAWKLAQIPRLPAYGIYQVTGTGECSRYEFAQAIVNMAGLERVRVAAISSRESACQARRPANSVLDNRRLIESGLGALPHWKEGLAQYLREGQRAGEFVLPASNPGERNLCREAMGS